jgi:PAS domain S-box-containing protein
MEPPVPGPLNEEITALIATLHQTGQRLEELTAGEVDTVADSEGRTFLLRSSQEQLREIEATKQVAILNALPAHIALLDGRGDIVSVNEPWRRFARENGFPGDVYGVGENYLAVCDPAPSGDSSETHQACAGVRSVLSLEAKTFSIEYPCHSPAEERWFLMTAAPLVPDAKKGAVVMHFDISERRRAENEMRESEARFSGAFEDAPIGVALLSIAGRFMRVNRALCDLLGYTKAEMLDRTFQDITYPEDLEADLGNVRRLIAGEAFSYQMEKRYVHARGSLIDTSLNVSLVRDRLGKPSYLIAQVQDIADRKRADEILRRASQQVVSGRRAQVRRELLFLALSTAAFFALAVRFDWFESATAWILARDVDQLDEVVFSMIFLVAGLAVFSVRRWRESESELTARDQSLALKGLLHEELERRVKERTEELDRANEALVAEMTEREKSEQATVTALKRLTEAQRIGKMGDWELDIITQAISWSPQVFEILGRDPRLGPPGYEENRALFEAASRSVLDENVARVIESGNPRDYELRAHRPNGVRVDLLGRAAARKDGDGRVVGLYGTVQDITQLKQSEAAVEESEQRYHSLFENMLEGYAYCSTVFEQDRLTGFTYLEVNRAFETLTGLKNVVGKNVTEIIPGIWEGNPKLFELYGRVALSGEPRKCEAYLESLDLWLSITAYSSDREHFVAVFDDITTRKRAQDASYQSALELEIERTRLVMAQQVARIGSWETDLKTGSVVWSEETHRIFETDSATFRPTRQVFLGLVHRDDRTRVDEAFASSLAGRSPGAVEYRVPLPDGRIKFAEERWRFLTDGKGIPFRAIGTCQDITERKTAEEKIVHLSRVYAVLSGINTLIVRVRDREELVKEACQIAVAAGGFRMSLIAVLDREAGVVVPVASAGEDEGLMTQVAALLKDPETAPKTMIARAMRDKAPVVSNDSVNDSRRMLRTRYVESEVRSIAILPLLIADEAVGVFVLYSSEVGFFQEEEMKLLGELANDIAFAKGAIRARDHKQKAEEALRASLKEKEALLKEVHHRVKNNLQVIASLLRLESNRIGHAVTKSVLKAMQNRIMAMAALHEALYRSGNFAQVDLAAYLKQLSGELSRSLSLGPGRVAFRLDFASVGVDLDQAVPCGLILNELASNALKHAFPNGRSGEVRVELVWLEDGVLLLRISDDGVGLPADFEARREKSLGLQLVSDLAKQLQGAFRVVPGPRAVFEVTFIPSNASARRAEQGESNLKASPTEAVGVSTTS